MPGLKMYWKSFKEKVGDWGERHEELLTILWDILVSPVVLVLYILIYVAPRFSWLRTKYDNITQQPIKILRWQERKERAERRKRRYAGEPLPKIRPRTLTLGSPGLESKDNPVVAKPQRAPKRVRRRMWDRRSVNARPSILGRFTVDQLGKCEFYKLPFEIRELVWKYIIGYHHIHIVKRKGKLGNIYCPVEDPIDPDRRDVCLLSRDMDGFYRPTAWPMDIRPLSLIASCRQIYSETIDFLYSHNTFSFDDFDVLTSFFERILPHRRTLVSSVHISADFTYRRTGNSAKFAQTFVQTSLQTSGPSYRHLTPWERCCIVLGLRPRLRNLIVTSSPLNTNYAGADASIVRDFLKTLNNFQVDRKFSLSWPSGNSAMPRLVWWGSKRNIPPNPRFEVRWQSSHDRLELLAFFIPFHVQCLHCNSYKLIRKGTEGLAETMLTRMENQEYYQLINRSVPLADPKVTRYWTFHTHCGGWIEFQYDWVEKTWSVTQGAKKISDEKAERYLAKNKGSYPDFGSAHERLQGLSIKPHPTVSANTDNSGKVIDIPTREVFYQIAGWTKI